MKIMLKMMITCLDLTIHRNSFCGPLDLQVGFRSGTVVSGYHPIGNWWGSSMPFQHTFGFMIGDSVKKNTNIDKKMFVWEVVGGAIFMLFLLCLLLHYCRRKCSKPCQLFKKLCLPSRVKDQSISTSCVSSVVSQYESEFSDGNRHPESSGHREIVTVDVHVNQVCAVGEADMHTPALQHTYSSSQEFSPREESLSCKENDHRYASLESLASLRNSTKSLEKEKRYGSPDKEDHGHSFSTRSLFEEEEQIFSPHSQQQVQPQHLAAQAISQQHLQEAGTGDWKPQHVVMSVSVSIQPSLSDELLTEKGLTEVDRRKPLSHPQAWFVSLDGHSNTVRHSYTDLQPGGRNGVNNSLDYEDDMDELKRQEQVYPQKDLDEMDQSGSERGTAVFSPEDNNPRCVLKGGSSRGSQLPSLQQETIKRSVGSPSEPLPSTEHKITGHHGADSDGNDSDDDSHQRASKKNPWQKREERPVLRFNLK